MRHASFPYLVLLLSLAGCASVTELAGRLKDDGPQVRRAAADKLARLGSRAEPVVPELAEALRSKDYAVRRNAWHALARIGPTGIPHLVQGLKDTEWLTTKEWEKRLRDPTLAETLETVLMPPSAWAGAIHDMFRQYWFLTRRARTTCIPELAEVLEDDDPVARRWAITALGVAARVVTVPLAPLIKATRDEDARVRMLGVLALQRNLRSPHSGLWIDSTLPGTEALATALEDKNVRVRTRAAMAIYSLCSQTPGIHAVIAAFRQDRPWMPGNHLRAIPPVDPDAPGVDHAQTGWCNAASYWMYGMRLNDTAWVRETAIKALGNMGLEAAEAVPELIKALSSEDAGARMWAALALGELGPLARDAVPALATAIRNGRSEWVCNAAAEAIAKIGPDREAGVEQLVETIAEGSRDERCPGAWGRRHFATKALGAFGSHAAAAAPALETLAQSDEDRRTRKAAARALKAINTH